MPTKSPEGSAQLVRKEAVVTEIGEKLAAADAAVLAEYRGLTVTQLADLRAALRPSGTEFKVFKNTLARRAAEVAGRDDLLPMLEGPVAIAFVNGDAVGAAKALANFSRDVPTLVIKGGLLGTKVLQSSDVDALSKVPPREELLARLAGGFKAPLARTAGALSGLQRKTAYALKALIDQRVAGGEAAADTEATGGEPESGAAQEEAPAAEVEASAPETDQTEAAADEPAATEITEGE
jgi:large subunit ribosomal protein L10